MIANPIFTVLIPVYAREGSQFSVKVVSQLTRYQLQINVFKEYRTYQARDLRKQVRDGAETRIEYEP
jgi:hypothetical protein